MRVRLFRRREEEERKGRRKEEREEEDVYDADELSGAADVISALAKDPDVSVKVKAQRPLIPLDSHKLDFSRIPSDKLDYFLLASDLQIYIQELLSDDETIKFLESYNILTQARLLSAVDGWLTKMILRRG